MSMTRFAVSGNKIATADRKKNLEDRLTHAKTVAFLFLDIGGWGKFRSSSIGITCNIDECSILISGTIRQPTNRRVPARKHEAHWIYPSQLAITCSILSSDICSGMSLACMNLEPQEPTRHNSGEFLALAYRFDYVCAMRVNACCDAWCLLCLTHQKTIVPNISQYAVVRRHGVYSIQYH